MPDSHPFAQNYSLKLSNGVEWRLIPGDQEAEPILERFANVLKLERADCMSINSSVRNLLVRVTDIPKSRIRAVPNGYECFLRRFWPNQEEGDYWRFGCISAAFSVDASTTGAMPLHSALAEYEGSGVILSGPSGAGKSTASRRFPHPWRSLCDDTTFLARSGAGIWRAHPWPTWSAFLKGGLKGRWDATYSVPVKAIFFLNHAEDESVETMGDGEALIRMVNASSQVSFFARTMENDPITSRRINNEWFSNLNDLAAKIPIYRLNLSLTGHFWKFVELVIAETT